MSNVCMRILHVGYVNVSMVYLPTGFFFCRVLPTPGVEYVCVVTMIPHFTIFTSFPASLYKKGTLDRFSVMHTQHL